MGGTEKKYISEAFDSNWIAPLGPNVNLFEQKLEDYIQQDVKVAALSSGTAALHLALKLLGVEEGDEIICQSFTFAGSANPIKYVNAVPVFVDSEEKTWNMSPELLEKAIVDRMRRGKKPAAIIVVHLYGMPYMVKEIHEIANFYKIPVVEDAAEALGSVYNERMCGSFGDFGVLSFNGNKIITTSGGGALCVKSDEQKSKTVFLATQAKDNAPHYEHSSIGFNYRMSNVLAGIGCGQMEVLPSHVQKRRDNYDFYYKNLNSLKEIMFLEEPSGVLSNRWLSCILLDDYEQREQLRLALERENIESRPLWKPMHLQPIFKDCRIFKSNRDVSEDLFKRGLCIPSGSNLEESDLERIVSIIAKQLKNV